MREGACDAWLRERISFDLLMIINREVKVVLKFTWGPKTIHPSDM